MSAVRRLAVGTVATVARRGNSGAELELGYRGIGRSACRRDRHDLGGQAEVFEEMCGDAGIGDERVIASCRLHGIDPFAYLDEVLRVSKTPLSFTYARPPVAYSSTSGPNLGRLAPRPAGSSLPSSGTGTARIESRRSSSRTTCESLPGLDHRAFHVGGTTGIDCDSGELRPYLSMKPSAIVSP